MPRIDDLVERIGGSSYISFLDLCKGYWQVPPLPREQRNNRLQDTFWTFSVHCPSFPLAQREGQWTENVTKYVNGELTT